MYFPHELFGTTSRSALLALLCAGGSFVGHPEHGEKERVIQNEHIGTQNAIPGALKKADPILLRVFGLVATETRRAQATFRANQVPYFRIGLDFEIGKAAVLRFARPFLDPSQFLGFR